VTAVTELALDAARAALLIVDVQERLAAAMDRALLAGVERHVPVLVELARRLGLPVVVSEQYRRGLGASVPAVERAIAPLGDRVHRFDKLVFSVCDAEPFDAIWRAVGRDQWIVTGMETHVCVYQSARGLRQRGAAVHVPRDAVASRTVDNRDVGLELIDRAGGVVTSSEAVLFDLLRRAGTDDFKAVSAMIR
jgi:nicotinamidase-related amidase